MKKFFTVCTLLSLLVSCKNENKPNTTPANVNDLAQQEATPLSPAQEEAREIAMASGLEAWDNVTEVQFTFNVDRGENHMERHWTWKPKTQDITMTTAQDSVTYNRKDMDSTATNADKAFINDSYWLLPQMHLVWDKDATVKVQDTATAPIAGTTLKKITITYPSEGGYTPGDAYDFYYNEDYNIQEWVYRKGDAAEPSMTTTWEDYKTLEDIDISTVHNTKDGNTKLYFTKLAVKTE